MQKASEERKLVGMLLIDVKGALHHVSRNYLLRTIESMGADGDLIRWTDWFMSDRSVRLVSDTHQCTEVGVETGEIQRSPALPIQFAIYLSSVFRNVKKEVEGCTATSFPDDCGWLVTTDLVE